MGGGEGAGGQSGAVQASTHGLRPSLARSGSISITLRHSTTGGAFVCRAMDLSLIEIWGTVGAWAGSEVGIAYAAGAVLSTWSTSRRRRLRSGSRPPIF